MADVNLRNVDEKSMCVIRQAAALTSNTTTGLFIYATVKYAEKILRENGSPVPTDLDPMLRRGPLTDIERRLEDKIGDISTNDMINAYDSEVRMLRGRLENLYRHFEKTGMDIEELKCIADNA